MSHVDYGCIAVCPVATDESDDVSEATLTINSDDYECIRTDQVSTANGTNIWIVAQKEYAQDRSGDMVLTAAKGQSSVTYEVSFW